MLKAKSWPTVWSQTLHGKLLIVADIEPFDSGSFYYHMDAYSDGLLLLEWYSRDKSLVEGNIYVLSNFRQVDKIDIPFVTKRMNATLVDRPASIWRQDPSDEVDAAWLVAEDPRPFAISREEVIALGQDPDKAVKWPEEYGLGSDMYAARIDVFHQIHCLDAIRREVWFDYYYGEKYQGGFANTTGMHKLHLTHCIAYIMENLMCAANVDVYTHFWTDAFSYPHPDFQIQHKCRSFDAILDWQQKHAVDVHKPVQLTRPGDSAPARKMSHDFKALFGYYDAHEDTGDTGGVDA